MRSLPERATIPQAALLATGGVRHVLQDQTICAMGEAADSILKVFSGMVRTCRYLHNGRRQIEAFHRQGDIFGFEVGAQYSLSSEALSDCTLVVYPRKLLDSPTIHQQGLAAQLYQQCVRNLERAHAHSVLLGQFSALEKLAEFLTDEWAHSTHGTIITLAMSRRDIADYLGLTVETVSRTLAALRQSQVIDFSSAREIYLRDAKALRLLRA